MKRIYSRLPWCRLQLTQRALCRAVLYEQQSADQCLHERRLKRLETKRLLRQVVANQ